MSSLKYAINALKLFITKTPLVILLQIINIILSTILTLIPIYIVKEIIESYQSGKEFDKITIRILIYLLVIFIANVIILIINFITGILERTFKARVAVMFYKKLDSVDYDFHENPDFLNNYTRALENGANYIYSTAINQIQLIKIIVQSIGVFSIVFQMHYLAVVYAFLVGIIYTLIKFKTASINFIQNSKQRQAFRERAYISRKYMIKDSIPDLKTTEIDSLLRKSHFQVEKSLLKVIDQYGLKRSILEYIGDFIILSIYPITLGIVAYSILKDNVINVADFASLTVAATTLSSLVSSFVTSFTNVQRDMVECKIPFDLLTMPSSIEGIEYKGVEKDFERLELKNVEFGYTDKLILKDINMYIKKGEKIAIVGSNGAGKTTLVKLLLRLYDVTNGSIHFNNQNYKTLNTESLRKQIGAVFQNPEIYSVTIAENVLTRKVESEEDYNLVKEALVFSGLWEYCNTLPDGINTMVTREFAKKGAIFSGGQIQKLAIARGYAGRFNLLMLDEPSSALDPLAEAELYHKMLEMGKDKTIIFISHRLSTTVNVDRIYLFEEGTIIESGSHDELMMIEEGKYRLMFNSQSEKYIRGEDHV